MTRLVDAVLVDDERSDKAAKLDERVPVPAITRQSGGFNGEDCTHPAFADRRQKLLEARPADAGPRTAEIFIDDDGVFPAKSPRALCKAILASPALGVVDKLIGRGLPNIDVSAARKMFSGDLHDLPLGPSGSPLRLPSTKLRSTEERFPALRPVELAAGSLRRTGLAGWLEIVCAA